MRVEQQGSTYHSEPSRRRPARRRRPDSESKAPDELDPQQARGHPIVEKAHRNSSTRRMTPTNGRKRSTDHGKARPDKPSRPEQVLVVDDEVWITDVLAEQLAIEGFDADVTNSSEDVMELLAAKPYDLVILDIHMPPPDGLTLLQEIREAYPFLAVLMLTAFSDADTASRNCVRPTS